MQLFFKLIKRNLAINCRKNMRAANLKTFNINDNHQHLFQQMMHKPGLLFLKDVFNSNGYGLRIAGGAVRDLLCEKVPDDIDLATTAVPEKMINLLKKFENVRLITTKAGEKHGTIIARIDDKAQYEITTLRIDKITDGRHAEVEFIEDWKLDASRRDLTFNSLFLDFDGTIYDYFNGIEHLKNRKVLFVGDPIERMEEDYLRILRYFRFYIRYGNLVDHDKDVLNAIEKCKDGLHQISGPRIWTELKKILSYKNSIKVLDLIFNQLKLGVYMGFNENNKSIDKVEKINSNLDKFNNLIEQNKLSTATKLNDDDKKLNYLSIISALLDNEDELIELRERLSLSNQELYTAKIILEFRDQTDFDLEKVKKEIVLTPKSEKDRKKTWFLELFKYRGDVESYLELKYKPLPVFPNLAMKIMPKLEKKSQAGIYLDKLCLIWIDSNYTLTENELLIKFDELLASSSFKEELNKSDKGIKKLKK